jgi:hypothetical protein
MGLWIGLVVPVDNRGPLANVNAKGCRSLSARQKSLPSSLISDGGCGGVRGGEILLCDFHDEKDDAKGRTCSVGSGVPPETQRQKFQCHQRTFIGSIPPLNTSHPFLKLFPRIRKFVNRLLK